MECTGPSAMDGAVELTGTLWGTHGTEGLTITTHHAPVMGEYDKGKNRFKKIPRAYIPAKSIDT